MDSLSLVVGLVIGLGLARLWSRRVKGGRGQALPIAPLTRGSLASECQREQAWAWIARFRDSLDGIASRMAEDPDVDASDSLTLIGLAVRVCVNESDHRRKESQEIVE